MGKRKLVMKSPWEAWLDNYDMYIHNYNNKYNNNTIPECKFDDYLKFIKH